MADATTKYLGKYRGTVVTNVDPMNQGRLQVRVPDVLGEVKTSWAMPSFPMAGSQTGFYHIPPINAGVWIEFEQGDVTYPVWVGCWYGSQAELPADALKGSPSQPNMVVQTQGKQTIVLSDVPGSAGITLKAASGASIVIDDTGIKIDNGKGASITLSGNQVSVNNGAHTVT